MAKRIIITGGSGKAGKHVSQYLLDQGHSLLNLDIVPHPLPGVRTLLTDLTDSGQVFNAFSSHFSYAGLAEGPAPKVDAVVHLAAIPSLLLKPDNVCYATNVISTYNVLEAASKLGIKKIIIASSETTYGVCFAEGKAEFEQLPLVEEYDINPPDSYALSKVCNEKTARGFAKRFGSSIYALRIGNVIEPSDYARFPGFLDDPSTRYRNVWSYIDARDLGQIIHLAVLSDKPGFRVYNATNDTITTREPTSEVLKKYSPKAAIVRPLDLWEGPLSNKKVREELGFKEDHNWRKYVNNWFVDGLQYPPEWLTWLDKK